jgi:folate-binding protein YgfZ
LAAPQPATGARDDGEAAHAMTASFRISREVITARGKDARTFLHSQLSNDIAGLAVGTSRYAFALEPTGKIAAFVRVQCVADDHFVLDVDPGCGEAALKRLNKFKIRVACEFTHEVQEVVALRRLNVTERTTSLARNGAVAAWREADGAVDVFAAASVEVGTLEDFHRERVRCTWPIFGIDITSDSLPAETSLNDVCVSFTKGCYPGQELVERMDSRGSTAPRRLMRLPCPAVAGSPYRLADGTEIGMCTSVAGDYALVMVQRAHLGVVEQLARS